MKVKSTSRFRLDWKFDNVHVSTKDIDAFLAIAENEVYKITITIVQFETFQKYKDLKSNFVIE